MYNGCYKMEWINTQTYMRGKGSCELALEAKKKDRQMATFLNIWFWYICTIDLMNDLGLDR